jgi:hypothetical protein
MRIKMSKTTMRSFQIFLNSQKTKMRSFFSKLVAQEFGDEYLNRCPTQEEKQLSMAGPSSMVARIFISCLRSFCIITNRGSSLHSLKPVLMLKAVNEAGTPASSYFEFFI